MLLSLQVVSRESKPLTEKMQGSSVLSELQLIRTIAKAAEEDRWESQNKKRRRSWTRGSWHRQDLALRALGRGQKGGTVCVFAHAFNHSPLPSSLKD